METFNSLIYTLLNEHFEKLKGTVVMLGSANLPYAEVNYINNLPLNFNAAEGKRFNRAFPGCHELDSIEAYGETLLNSLFYTQEKYLVSFDPLSGTQANQIVYNAVLKPKSIVLSLALTSGGHSSHIEYLKKEHTVIEYHYNEEVGDIDYEEIYQLCQKYHPQMIISGASSYPLLIRYDILGDICKKNNCYLLADISHTALYIIEGNHPTPFGVADFITFTTHKTTRGPRGAILAYRKKYEGEINFSIYPLTQGAPIFTQNCAKVMMLEKLSKRKKNIYCQKILRLSALFIDVMADNSIPLWLNRTDTHLCILDLHGFPQTAEFYQELLEECGIYANACFLPKDDKVKTGLRFGFMYLATLQISDCDFIKVCNIIGKIIKHGIMTPPIKVADIIIPYFIKYKKK